MSRELLQLLLQLMLPLQLWFIEQDAQDDRGNARGAVTAWQFVQ